MEQFIYDKYDLKMWAQNICEKARKSNLACMYETHDCSEHEYFDVYFMTDKFGGIFACLRLKDFKVQLTDYKTPFVDIAKLSDSIDPILKACIHTNEVRNIRKGKVYQDIVWNVEEGEINPNASYIQTFDKYETFSGGNVYPDVTFKTTAGETSYLYKVD